MKKYVKRTALMIFLLIALASAGMLAYTAVECQRTGYDEQTLLNAVLGKSYTETEEYAHQAASAVYDAVETAAVSSRMETNGAYNPKKIIRLEDYLDDGTVYDSMPESEKEGGICYYLDDLYQWSLKGVTIRANILWEDYKPLFYGSIQEYANTCNAEYNVIIGQVQEAMDQVQEDVAVYQQWKKATGYDSCNMRYALLDLGNKAVYTNVETLSGADADSLIDYFQALGSYYIFDSRSGNVQQRNVGDYFSHNTAELMEEKRLHVTGEYQFFAGIDTSFPASDEFARNAAGYAEVSEWIVPHVRPIITSLVILVIAVVLILVILLDTICRFLFRVMENLRVAAQISACFAGYVAVSLLLSRLPGKWILLVVWNLLVFAVLLINALQKEQILKGIHKMSGAEGREMAKIPAEKMFPGNRQLAEEVNALGDHLWNAVQEQMKSERMKAALITNVSHDLKTPLTSIINYVDLMKREPIANETVRGYLEVLDQKSQRLKQLTEDLVEASRASSGNVVLNIELLDMKELLMQTCGEFEERFAARRLKLVTSFPDTPVCVEADGRRLWRIIENLFRNVEKYAMPGTRVYLEVNQDADSAWMSLKNISEMPLNISPEELTERFTRGDESRSTEGSGLGLSIAKDLTTLQKGTFDIFLDGDLFKVTVTFPRRAGKEME